MLKRWLTSLVCILLTHSICAQGETLQLTEWTVKGKAHGKTYACNLPASVHTILQKNGVIQDPFKNQVASTLSWIEEDDWHFETQFKLNEEQCENERILLSLKEVDTHVKIYLDNQLIGEHHNFFSSINVDLKEYVKANEDHHLRIELQSPITYGDSLLKEQAYGFPADNDQTKNKIGPFSRKPAYHFGWDFAPKCIPSGIYQIPEIQLYPKANIENISTQLLHLSDVKASLQTYINMSNEGDYKVEVYNTTEKELAGEGKIGQEGTVDFEVTLPKKWWPKGFGEAHLYTFEIKIFEGGQQIDSKELTTGLRTSELVQETDDFGRSFYFKVNGYPVFCKGINHSPLNVFLDQVDEEDYQVYFERLNELGVNMIRVWGGGSYEREKFYELCDKNGIMVWQDFMFANTTYPTTEAFYQTVKEEAVYQIQRLSHHPCIVHWNGNNEIDVAWKNWGWQKTYEMSGKTQKKMLQSYDYIFNNLLPEQIKKYTRQSYTHTSPLSNWGPQGDFKSGSMHYWGVWHGKNDIDLYQKNVGRFMAEYGFQSYPSSKVLKNNIDGFSGDMKDLEGRQKSYIGDAEIQRQIDLYFGSSNQANLPYYSQLIQALAMEKAVLAHRINKPKCYGSLIWQGADCWPGASWSLLDLNRDPKTAFSSVKSLMGTVQILEEVHPEHLILFAVNDSIKDLSATLELSFYTMDGNLIKKLLEPARLPKSVPNVLSSVELKGALGDHKLGEVYAVASLKKNGRVLNKRIILLEVPNQLSLKNPEGQFQFKQEDGKRWVLSSTFVYRPHWDGLPIRKTSGYMLPNEWYEISGEEVSFYLPPQK